jgi:glycosyltransferase involved in cell wall biosynthesis
MPCYNAAPFLEQAIRSVLDQAGPPLELIVVDDGSTDNSVAVAEGLGPAVRVLHQKNQGPAAARNRGVRAARGEFIAFLDADDVWLPGSLSRRLQCFGDDPQIGLVYGDFKLWHPARKGPQAWQSVPWPREGPIAKARESGWLYPELLLDSFVCTITVMIRRNVFDAVGGFDESLRTGEDYDLWLRVAQDWRCVWLNEPVAWYRLHKGGTTRVPREEPNQYQVVLRSMKRFGAKGKHGAVLPGHLLKQRLYRLCFDHAYLHLQRGKAAIAQQYFFRALQHSVWHPKAWAYLVFTKLDGLLRH